MLRTRAETWVRRHRLASQAIYLCLGESEHPQLEGPPSDSDAAQSELVRLVMWEWLWWLNENDIV
jgi:hypothetical protein